MNPEVIEREEFRGKAEVGLALELNRLADEAAGVGGKRLSTVLLCFDGKIFEIPRSLANTPVSVELRRGYTIQVGEKQFLRGPETADLPLSLASRYVHMFEQPGHEKVRELLGLGPLRDFTRDLGVAETIDLALARVEAERARLLSMKAAKGAK